MVENLLDTIDVNVFGGPVEVSVDVDFGPEGKRGSQIFVGLGNPNLTSTIIGQDPNIFDMYINIDSADTEDYLYQYQYQNVSGVNTWVRLFKLLPNTYAFNSEDRLFTDGVSTTINIPLINLIPISTISNYSSEDFNIQYNIIGSANPIASSMSIGEILDDKLPVVIKAVEYNGSSWVNLNGERTIHIFINVV